MKKRVLRITMPAACRLGRSFAVFGPLMLAAVIGQADPLDHWHPRGNSPLPQLNAVTYGSGLFVAVGSGILTSPDGVTWSNQTPAGPFWNLNGVAHGDGLFVACGPGVILSSSDGVNWTQQSIPAPAPDLNAVAFGNSRFVAVGGEGILTSTNGMTWSVTTNGSAGTLQGITFGGGRFVAVSYPSSTLESADGLNWITRDSGWDHLWAVAYGAGTFAVMVEPIAYAVPSEIISSPDLQTWTRRHSGCCPTTGGITYANGIFVAAGGGEIASSMDGIAWSARQDLSPNRPWPGGVAYGNSTFVVVGDQGLILQSDSFAPARINGAAMTTNGGFQLTVSGEIGRSYRLQATTNAAGSDWVDLVTYTNIQATTNFVDGGAASLPRRFYRVVSP